MKRDFEKKQDLAQSQVINTPEIWSASKEDIEKAYRAKSDKFVKYKERFED